MRANRLFLNSSIMTTMRVSSVKYRRYVPEERK